MAQVNDDDVPNDVVVPSQSLTAETTSTQRQRLTGTQLPTLPFDLLPEILCRLPVKLLVQLRCLCKFFNSLISDPKFVKKHLQLSTKRHHLMLTSRNNFGEFVQYDFPMPSVFSNSIVTTQTQLYPPNIITRLHNFVHVLASCDGIFCGMLKPGSYFLWNPSIQKFKLLPPLPPSKIFVVSFGYDPFIDNYKVIVVSCKNQVSVNTLGNDYWTIIKDLPHSYRICGRGVFLSGTVNWFALSTLNSQRVIVSFDLEKDSYQNLSKPDLVNYSQTLGVLKDCLCIFAIGDMFLDVWVMKEYGNKESWTKLYTVPHMEDLGSFTYNRALYISEDDQMLIEVYNRKSKELKLVVYDSKNGTFNIPEIQSNHGICPKNYIYIESLISP